MKTSSIQYLITLSGIILCLMSIFLIDKYFAEQKTSLDNRIISKEMPVIAQIITTEKLSQENANQKTTTTTQTTTTTMTTTLTTTTQMTTTLAIKDQIAYENLSLQELTDKLNRNLYSTLSGTGNYFAQYAKETGLDPYLALAIVLHETGCKWGCSKLVKSCNNIGGIKGTPSCNGGSYKRYDTLEDGINGFLNLVFKSYYNKGLTTPELMNPKYAEDPNWAYAVSKYIETIRKS